MKNYYGDVDITVKMRYRLDASFKKLDKDNRPSEKDVLKVLKNHTYNDVLDTEELEVLSVDDIGENNLLESQINDQTED